MDENKKTKSNFQNFLDIAREHYGKEDLNLAKANCAAALNVDLVEDDESYEPAIFLLYYIEKELGNMDKAREHLKTCIAHNPSSDTYIRAWYSAFENISLQEVIPCDVVPFGEIKGEIYSTVSETQAITPDWYYYTKNETSSLDPIIKAIKFGTDNYKNYIEMNDGYIVSAKLCKKLGLLPTDIFVKEIMQELNQYFKVNL